MIGKETIGAGAPHVCPDCKKALMDQVCRSAAGFYIGTMCYCGPYTRESGYYPSQEAAQAALDAGSYGRTHEFRGGGAKGLQAVAIQDTQEIDNWATAVLAALARKAEMGDEI